MITLHTLYCLTLVVCVGLICSTVKFAYGYHEDMKLVLEKEREKRWAK